MLLTMQGFVTLMAIYTAFAFVFSVKDRGELHSAM